MSTLLFPLILVAFGGAAFVLLRDGRLLSGALLIQWLGLAWIGAQTTLIPAAARTLGLPPSAAAEVVTALVCAIVLLTTLRGVNAANRPAAAIRRATTPGDYLLPGAAVLLGGVAGVGFAALFPLGDAAVALSFYWTVLAAALGLVIEGARNPVKLAVGLLSVLNAVALLVAALSVPAPGTGVLGLLAATRIGLAALMAYGWGLLVLAFGEPSLEPLFNRRRGVAPTQMAIVPVQPVAPPAGPETEDVELEPDNLREEEAAAHE